MPKLPRRKYQKRVFHTISTFPPARQKSVYFAVKAHKHRTLCHCASPRLAWHRAPFHSLVTAKRAKTKENNFKHNSKIARKRANKAKIIMKSKSFSELKTTGHGRRKVFALALQTNYEKNDQKLHSWVDCAWWSFSENDF